jgi:uncharacterized protein YndB with AHSA1/START domain
MTMSNKSATNVTTPSDLEIAITRLFNAPRVLVWRAWTQPENIVRWFGPKGWTLPVCEMDFRPGGEWFYCMRGPEGEESCGKAIYREIVEPERFVYTDYFADANGTPVAGMPEALVTVEFIEQDGKTLMKDTVRYPTKEDRDRVLQMGMAEGTAETLDRLEDYLATR